MNVGSWPELASTSTLGTIGRRVIRATPVELGGSEPSVLGRTISVEAIDCRTGSFDYPDVGQGAMSAADVHQATLTILAFSTAHVMTAEELRAKVNSAARAKVA